MTLEVDHWASECAEWAASHWDDAIASLPGADCQLSVWVVREVCDDPVDAFCVFGATRTMPFSVYCALQAGGRYTDSVGERYAFTVYRRRSRMAVAKREGEQP